METYLLTETKLNELLAKANKEGAIKVLVEMGLQKNQISQREAIRRYGKVRIEIWRKEGKIKPVKIRNGIYFPLCELERLNNINDLVYSSND